MIICAFSDIHGQIGFNVEPCDVLCVCGDIVPLDIQAKDSKVFKWLRESFVPWITEQKCGTVLYVPGNHDFAMQRNPKKVREILDIGNIHMLIDEGFTVTKEDGREVSFYGTPWCKKFYNWAFMNHDDKEMAEIFDKIPDRLNILLTHDAPFGASDIMLQENPYCGKDEHIGNTALAEAVSKKSPMIHLHGHIHSSNHEAEKIGDTDVYNVSLLDEEYKMAYKPLYISI